jgi:hypothetical protein
MAVGAVAQFAVRYPAAVAWVVGGIGALGLGRAGWKWYTSARRLRRRYRARYVLRQDLDAESRTLLARAISAIESVNSSQASSDGLLNTIANDVILPHQLWEIARLLRTQTGLRSEQTEARRGLITPELVAVLDPQQRALARSVAAVTDRIADLELYAYRVQETDAALRALELLKSNERYRDLLAQTDDAEGMRDLINNANTIESTLAHSLRSAIETGQTLAVPSEPTRDT